MVLQRSKSAGHRLPIARTILVQRTLAKTVQESLTRHDNRIVTRIWLRNNERMAPGLRVSIISSGAPGLSDRVDSWCNTATNFRKVGELDLANSFSCGLDRPVIFTESFLKILMTSLFEVD